MQFPSLISSLFSVSSWCKLSSLDLQRWRRKDRPFALSLTQASNSPGLCHLFFSFSSQPHLLCPYDLWTYMNIVSSKDKSWSIFPLWVPHTFLIASVAAASFFLQPNLPTRCSSLKIFKHLSPLAPIDFSFHLPAVFANHGSPAMRQLQSTPSSWTTNTGDLGVRLIWRPQFRLAW